MADQTELPISHQSKGGFARKDALTPEQRIEIARKAAQSRWDQSIPRATHEGILPIGELQLPVAVLSGGIRVLTSKALMTALGRPWKGTYKGTNLPNFMGASNLLPFVNKELMDVLSPIEYVSLRSRRVSGYRAELLPLVCDVYLAARVVGNVLTARQLPTAAQAEILVRSLSKIGIVALIDEATGYQEVRDKLALQKILDRYLSAEKARWAKTFPDDFYRKLFQVRGLPYNPTSVRKPGFIGHDTNNIVYDRLAPGVLKKLNELNPKTEKGYRKDKHHQFFTQDYGVPELKQHILNLMFLMDAAGKNNWKGFLSMLNRAAPRKGDNFQLDLVSDPSAP